jgi:hypothetical protein
MNLGEEAFSLSPRLNFTKEIFSKLDQIVKVWDDEFKEISVKSVISVKRVIKQVSFGYLLFLWASRIDQNASLTQNMVEFLFLAQIAFKMNRFAELTQSPFQGYA